MSHTFGFVRRVVVLHVLLSIATGAAAFAADEPAAITRSIDASKTVGPFPALTAYRNTSIQKAPAPALAALASRELGRAKITRCWLNLDEMWDYRTRKFTDDYPLGVHKYDDVAEKHTETWGSVSATNIPLQTYLRAFSKQSDEIMLTIRRYERDILDGKLGVTMADWKMMFKHALVVAKKAAPNLRYIEVGNEYALKGFAGATADEYYEFYKLGYQAVRQVNAELKLTGDDRLLVGGPVCTGDIIKKLKLFFENFAKDPAADKRLDFVSWHEYHDKYAHTAHREAQVKAMMTAAGLASDVPMFITEHDPYHPRAEAREYNLINGAALVKSLYFADKHSPGMKIMPWVLYHDVRIQTRFAWFDGPNKVDTKADQIRMFPAGCSMKLLHQLSAGREIAVDNSIEADHIVLASVDGMQVIVEAVNYGEPREVSIRVDQLPAEGSVRIVKYLIDEQHSNAVTHPDYRGGVQQVGEATVTPTAGSITLKHEALSTHGIVQWRIMPRVGAP
jgi:hypothetical protein